MSEQNFNEEIGEILSNLEGVSTVEDHTEMGKVPTPYFDKYFTAEQQERDRLVSHLLKLYVENYERKTRSNNVYKAILFTVNIGIVILFTFIMIKMIDVTGYSAFKRWDTEQEVVQSTEASQTELRLTDETNSEIEADISIESVVAFVTACVSYLTLVFGILTIITKYVFPKKEEAYITEIVKTIQKNDLKNKRENMRVDGFELPDKNGQNSNNTTAN